VTGNRRVGWPLGLAVVLLAGFALPGCGGSAEASTTVTVLGTWTGDEQTGFEAMVSGFEQKYGIQVDYTGTRDSSAVLTSDLEDGNPPDLAVLSTPGQVSQYAAAGTLLPLDGALASAHLNSQYGPSWRRLMQDAGPTGARHYYAIIVKAALKSIIWYDPQQLPARYQAILTSPKLTWQQLRSLTGSMAAHGTTPWCMGFEDSSNSGWPGTDWIEDILLHQAGPAAYDRWIAGTLPWTSPQVEQAWETFGQIVNTPGMVHGGTEAELLTNYGNAGQPMFDSPPGCYLDHEGSFITAFYTEDTLGSPGSGSHSAAHPQPETDFRFVPFPALTPAGQGAEEIAGDLLGMFRDTLATRELIAYLTTPQAQEAWIKRPGSGAISVNKLVPLRDYPDPVSRALADTLTHARDVEFDAADAMPQVMEDAFWSALLEYLDRPSQLNAILRGLDQVQKAAY
jgi:alpha-glucoside transport system substrate-binding protein